MKHKHIYLIVSLLAGCAANPGVVQLSPDTYLLAKADKAGIFGNPASFKVEVIQEANAFAQAQGKIAIPINLNQIPVAPGRFASIEYQFRVVDPSDPEAKRTSLTKRADVVVENTQKSSIDMNVRHETSKLDVYAELLKLDDLRKRGVITEAEFDVQKKKLLSSN